MTTARNLFVVLAASILLLPLAANARQEAPAQGTPKPAAPAQPAPKSGGLDADIRRQAESYQTQAAAARAKADAARAQAEAEHATAAAEAKPAESWPGDETKLADVSFRGGTIGEYVEALRKVYGNFNVIVDPAVSGLTMPDVRLFQVPKGEALRAVEGTSMNDFRNPDNAVIIDATPAFYALRPRSPLRSDSDLVSRVWPLSGMLKDGAKVEDVLSSIQTLLEMSHEKAEIKFHKETGVLMMRGTGSATNDVERLLQSVTAQRRAIDASLVDSHMDELRRQLQVLSARLDALEGRPAPTGSQPAPPHPSPATVPSPR